MRKPGEAQARRRIGSPQDVTGSLGCCNAAVNKKRCEGLRTTSRKQAVTSIHTMPAGSRSLAWFDDVFGFDESKSYQSNRAQFRMEGESLVCPTSKHGPQFVGPFETPSLAELREAVAAGATAADGAKGLIFSHLATPTGVQSLIADPANAGAVFQAASQFNCLEMVGPGVSPREGIAIYASDPTQGPKCAIACPAATAFRNYLCLGGAGQGDKQIDCLADVGLAVGNPEHGYWTMQNGYALPRTRTAMRELGARLHEAPGLWERAEAALRVGVHWDTQVRPPHTHRVAQVFASAVPVAYSKSTASADWEPFARLVLRAAYEATLAVGALKAATTPGKRVTIFLTSLGGGAFGNRHQWIVDAVAHALKAFEHAPLDVVLVHYGTMVPRDWQAVQWPPAS